MHASGNQQTWTVRVSSNVAHGKRNIAHGVSSLVVVSGQIQLFYRHFNSAELLFGESLNDPDAGRSTCELNSGAVYSAEETDAGLVGSREVEGRLVD